MTIKDIGTNHLRESGLLVQYPAPSNSPYWGDWIVELHDECIPTDLNSRWASAIATRPCQILSNSTHQPCKNIASHRILLYDGQVRWFYACQSHKCIVKDDNLFARLRLHLDGKS